MPLASLLAQSPDPDSAVRLLDRYVESGSPEVLEELSRHPTALIYLVAIFGYSESLAETFLEDPSLVIQFAHDRHFTKLKSIEDLMQEYARYSVTHPDLWQSSQLARFKRRNFVRLALKDVLGLSTLGETTLELSTLADVILKNALAYCDQELEKRYGRPQYRDPAGRIARSGISIVSLGKLGGNELNYSSDIDLLFLYARDGETAGGSESSSIIPNKEYFVRLAEAIHRTLTRTTHYGEVYRVDLRQRPEGERGDLAIAVNSALEYYDHRARDWELQMLIKARHSAGDPRVTRDFLHGVESCIYRSPGDVNAVESERDELERTSQERRESRDGALDVKFHPGGIRDIEFLIQCLQRLHGGGDFWVRSGGTLLALRKLNDKGLVPDADFARLTSAYELFRRVEHRIQLKSDHHAHRLPAGHAALNRLARRVGLEVGSPSEAGLELVAQLKHSFALVDEIYRRLIHARPVSAQGTEFQLSATLAWTPDPGLDHYESTLRLLDSRAPDLARVVREVPLNGRARKNASGFLGALPGSSEYFRVAREHPGRVRRALEIAVSSPYLGQLVMEHPVDLAILDSLHTETHGHSPAQIKFSLKDPSLEGDALLLQARDFTSTGAGEAAAFPWTTESGLSFGEKMALLRNEYRTCMLVLGTRDCAELDSIFVCLNRWSSLATSCISSALAIAAGSLGKNYGCDALPFAVLGLGRLGLNEFDLAASVELVFVEATGTGAEEVNFGRGLADKTIEVLTSYTRDGSVFPVNRRLRPQLTEEGWVTTEDVLFKYLTEVATLDAVAAFAHARLVAGNIQLGRHLVSRLDPVLFERVSSQANIEDELRTILHGLDRDPSAPHPNARAASGDLRCVELTLAVLRLRHRLSLPARANSLERIAALRFAALISDADADALTRHVSFLRTIDHAVRLVTGLTDGLPENAAQIDAVESLTRHWGLIGPDASLAIHFQESQQQVRSLCLRLVALA